jgi:hypothetical protein
MRYSVPALQSGEFLHQARDLIAIGLVSAAEAEELALERALEEGDDD